MDKITQAKLLAEKYHKDETRKVGGGPYVEHPIRVAEAVSEFTEDEDAVIAALLHDTLESIQKAGLDTSELISEIEAISPKALEYVKELTHDKEEEEYNDYIERLSKDKVLRIIKLCDMIDNMTDVPTEQQKIKYKKGLKILLKDCLE